MTHSAQPAQFTQPGQGLALGGRVLVADGAMGTMLQASDVSLGDFDGHEGFPRQRRDRQLCLAGFFRSRRAQPDVVAFPPVTVGSAVSEALIAFHPEARYFPA